MPNRMFAYIKKNTGWVSKKDLSVSALRAGYSPEAIEQAHKELYDAPDLCFRYNAPIKTYEYRWANLSPEQVDMQKKSLAFFFD